MCERSCNATSQMSNCGALLCAIMKLVDFIHIMLVQFVWTNFPWGILMWRVFYGSWIHLRRIVVWWWYIVAKNTSAFSMNAWMEDRQRNARQLTLSAAVCLMKRKGRFIFSVARFIENLRGLSFTVVVVHLDGEGQPQSVWDSSSVGSIMRPTRSDRTLRLLK